MVDSDDVLLLRGPGFTPPPGAGEVCATVCRPADAADLDAYAARHLGPGHALHRTEHAGNGSPLLPVRSAGSGLPDGWSGSGRTGRAPPASGTRSRIPAPGTASSPVWEHCRASPSARERVLPCRCCARPAYGCLCGRVVRSPALATALTDAPIARLGVSDPRTWSARDWASDVVPHVVHGLVTYGINRFRGATAVTPVRGEVARAGLIGAATGLRSTWGLAALSWAPDVVRPGIASRLSRPWVRIIVLAGATGEFVADKSPSTPDRLSPSGLVPRLLLGALTGAAVSGHRNSGGLPVAGGVAGVAASLAAARAGERRRTVGRHGMRSGGGGGRHRRGPGGGLRPGHRSPASGRRRGALKKGGCAMPATGCSPRRVRFTCPDISWTDPLRHLIRGRSGPWGVCIGVGMRKSRAREGRW